MARGITKLKRLARVGSSLLLAGLCLTLNACPDNDGQTPQQLAAQLMQQAYLKASTAGTGDAFGITMAMDGDTLIIGSYFEDSNATGVNGNQADNSASNSGAVYVFTRTNGVWSQQAYVKASNTEAGDQFGQSVALSGATLAVGGRTEDSVLTGVTAGAPNEATTGNGVSNSSAVYVFSPL